MTDSINALSVAVEDYLTWLLSHGYSKATVHGRRYYLVSLVTFLTDLDVTDLRAVTPALLESYQRHLFHYRKRDGQPLSFRTQSQRLIPVKGFFGWLTRQGLLPFDPAASLQLPKSERRLPESILSVEEVEAVLAGPNTSTALGIRDRAVLEVFYSTAIRRLELAHLRVTDVDHARGVVFVRQGKGARDRFVPIGARAVTWVDRYLREVRPNLVRNPREETLFVSTVGSPLASDVLSRMASSYVKAGVPTKSGSCHLFRHTTAILMLDAGADVRHVAEMLGHQKLDTTMGYTRVSMVKLQEVHARCHPAEQPRGVAS